MSRVQTFVLYREVDATGISGTGAVADGATFPDGTTVLRWRDLGGDAHDRGVRPTTTVYDSAAAVEALHGHDGLTRLVWSGEPCPTCQTGTVRETVGMVCQTCGHDYAATP